VTAGVTRRRNSSHTCRKSDTSFHERFEMLRPEDRWIWDFWHIQDGDLHHLFYLQAPKSLGDPELRHRHATIGHATSSNLRDWTEHGTVLRPGESGSIDSTATWTGSIVRGDDDVWRMFYTGTTFLHEDAQPNIETITVALSEDLHTWRKDPTVELHPDPQWYERLGDSDWPEEAWRDPWVYRDKATWHMLITGRAATGDLMDRGVAAHATSPDLRTWTITEPLTTPGHGFAQLEVLQRVTLDGQPFVLFSAHVLTLTDARREAGGDTGTWIAPADPNIRLDEAINLTGPSLYSGRVVDLDGTPMLLAFATTDADGQFLGGVTDPMPIVLEEGRPVLSDQVSTF
jgi:beta-fructofuranosidase